MRQRAESPSTSRPAALARDEDGLHAGRHELWLGGDAECALYGERCVGEETARVTLPCPGNGVRAEQQQRGTARPGRPGAELDRRPVVVGAAEGDDDGSARVGLAPREEGDVAERRVEHGCDGAVDGAGLQKLVRRGDEQQVDVLLRREPDEIVSGPLGREDGGPCDRAPSLELFAAGSNRRRGGSQARVAVDEPGEDQLVGAGPDDRLGNADQTVEARPFVTVRDEDGPRRDGRRVVPRARVERRILAQDGALEVAKRCARLEPELTAEHVPGTPVGIERLRLTPGAIQREHEEPAELLAKRVLADEALELGRGLGVTAPSHLGLETQLERHEPELFEA